MAVTDIDSSRDPLEPVPQRPLADAVLAVLAKSDEATLSAPEIAQAIGFGEDWHMLVAPIRQVAVALAQAGRIVIYRKGKPVDPNHFRGVYRLGLPRQD